MQGQTSSSWQRTAARSAAGRGPASVRLKRSSPPAPQRPARLPVASRACCPRQEVDAAAVEYLRNKPWARAYLCFPTTEVSAQCPAQPRRAVPQPTCSLQFASNSTCCGQGCPLEQGSCSLEVRARAHTSSKAVCPSSRVGGTQWQGRRGPSLREFSEGGRLHEEKKSLPSAAGRLHRHLCAGGGSGGDHLAWSAPLQGRKDG